MIEYAVESLDEPINFDEDNKTRERIKLQKNKKYLQGPVHGLCSSSTPQTGSVQSLVCIPAVLHAAGHAPQGPHEASLQPVTNYIYAIIENT